MCCHSERVMRVFGRLDYSGIALHITGSFIPWIYYAFYCNILAKNIYLTSVSVLGLVCVVISQWEKLSEPRYRILRSVMFSALGLSAVVPVVHINIQFGFSQAVNFFQMGWVCLVGALSLIGAFLYAMRIPERFFPGKCDLWFHSHQFFHIMAIAATIVNFHGMSNLQHLRYLHGGQCMEQP